MDIKNVDLILANSILFMADWGFHGNAIAKTTGMTIGQVRYRLKKFGVKLRDYRDGKTQSAAKVIKMTPCVKINFIASPGEKFSVPKI